MEAKSKANLKRKRVAPLTSSKAKNDIEPIPVNDDAFEFTDDMLEDIFKEVSQNEVVGNADAAVTKEDAPTKLSKPENSDIIDLDDWMPASLKSHSIQTPPSSKLEGFKSLANANKKNPGPDVTSTKNRKDMLFSSAEFEEDSTLGLRFVKRSVPASQLKELSLTLKKVSLYDATRLSDLEKDWFTYGVVSEYSQLRKEGGGRMDVTDLAADPFTVRFLLFGAAFIDPRKLAVGSIVCISKPKKGKPFNGKEAFIVNGADQILVAGMSRDFGLCGSSKKSGGVCRGVVNLKICRFCKFHAAALYKEQKMAKDVKAAAAGVGSGFKGSISPGLWNTQPNQTRFLKTAKVDVVQMKKDKEKLEKLNRLSTRSDPKDLKKPRPLSPAGFLKDSFTNSNSESCAKRKLSVSPEDYGSHTAKKPLMEVVNTPAGSLSKSSITPRLSSAKMKALQFIRENGTISTNKPKPKLSLDKEDTEIKKPSGITDEFLALMKEKPRDPALLEKAQALEREKRFDRLQVVEEVSEKLVATHEVPVRAIRCLECKKNFHALPMQCVLNKHACKVVAGTKRFFECNSCRNRTHTLERMPRSECSKCGVWSWRRAGMAVDRVCSVAPQLAVRGLEEKYVNSIVKDPNLNLLVPDQ